MILLSASGFAQDETKKELIKLSIDTIYPNGRLDILADKAPIIQKWNALFDEQNLARDLNKHRIDWKSLFPIKEDKIHKIKGERRYYGLVKKKYHYDIIQDAKSNQMTVHVKIHFYPSKKLKKKLLKKIPDFYIESEEALFTTVYRNMLWAQNRWNNQSPKGVRFKFEMVSKASDAHYSLKLTTMVGGLYDKFIFAPAPEETLSHEIGHMMGLDDEYAISSNAISKSSIREFIRPTEIKHRDYFLYQDLRCNLESIMCLRDTVYPYHIDHILGRIKSSENVF